MEDLKTAEPVEHVISTRQNGEERSLPFRRLVKAVDTPLMSLLKVLLGLSVLHWEDLWSWKQSRPVDSWQSAVCGAFAGGFAAAVTTPLDVAKTRIMLAKAGSSTAGGNVLLALNDVWRTHGLTGLFAGIVPRITAISLGGFIFLGAYDKVRSLLIM
ncbi:unnamed protein product [Ranitomeya imitator]|uniref:Mitochondrial S-adenosylmethionine carrier protein n=1 Tax=Ranitomeya imitator TaxID=111125 RepID=A0ABN9LEP6_9NEOB|nr:unnamed protein product [Ranitomeya imitator]